MSRVASEATDRPSLSHASEATVRPNRGQDADEPQGPVAMIEPLSHTRAKRATDLTASKMSSNRRTPLAMPGQFPKQESSPRPQFVLYRVDSIQVIPTSTASTSVATKEPQLAPPELETARAWLKPTHYAWFARVSVIFSTSPSYRSVGTKT